MKKPYTFICTFGLFFCFAGTQAQVLALQDFEDPAAQDLNDFPGWAATAFPPFDVGTMAPCQGAKSINAQAWTGGTSPEMQYIAPANGQLATGMAIEISFKYKILDEATSLPATADFGTMNLSYSTDGGATWTLYETIDVNDLPAACKTNSKLIAGVPAGSNFGWKLEVAFNPNYPDPNGVRVFIDDFKAIEQVSCIQPVDAGFTAGSVDFDSAEIFWADINATNPGQWEVVVCTSPGNPDINPFCGTPTSVNGSPYTVTNLNDGTVYYVYVRSVCGTNDKSVWTGPIAFQTTATQTHNLNWFMGIALAGASITIDVGDTVVWTFTDSVPHTVTSDAGSTEAFNSGSPQTGGTFSYTFTQVGSNPYHCNVHPSMVGTITVVQPASCTTAPSNLVATNTTKTTADLSWTEVNSPAASTWDVHVVSAGSPAPTAGTTPTDPGATANPYPKTGLTTNTSYDFYVRSVCGSGGVSAWAGPFAFSTACNTIPSPWLDDVEAHAPTTDISNSNCWTAISTTVYTWNIGNFDTPSFGTGPSSAFSGTNFFYVEASLSLAGDVAELISPPIDVSALTAPALKFYYHMFGIDMGDLHVDIHDGAVWNNDVLIIFGQQQTNDTDPWRNTLVNLTAYSGSGTIKIRFRAISAGSYAGDISLDDIEIKEGPACFPPISLTATGLTDTTADLDWTDGNNPPANTWDIHVIAAGGPAPTAGTTPTNPGITSHPYTKTGLIANTNYEFYVRADCGGGDISAWAGPKDFTTGFAVVNLTCGDTFTDTGGPTGDYSNNEDITYVIAPAVAGNLITVTFTAFELQSYNLLSIYDVMYVYDGPTTSALLIDSGNPPTASGFPAGGYSGMSIPGPFTSTHPSGALTFVFMSDGFVTRPGWEATVSCNPCPPVSNITVANIDYDSADVSWTSGGSETEWEVEYGPTGFTLGSGTTVSDNDGILGINLSGLVSNTEYDIYVTAICGPGDASAPVGPMGFSTQITCGDTFTDTGGPNGKYGNNENLIWIISPNVAGNVITLDFTLVDVDINDAELKIFNGTGTGGTVLEADLENPGSFTSTDSSGALTVTFSSNASFVGHSGWQANVTCGLPLSCPPVTGIMITNIGIHSTDIGWTPAGSETEWKVEYGPDGFVLGSGTFVNVTGTSTTTLGSLAGTTNYDVYVTAICGPGDESTSKGPEGFTTEVDPSLTCGDAFNDSGGQTGFYGKNENITWVVSPDMAGNLVTVTFTAFAVYAGFDALYVYDGPSTSDPLISSGNPPTVSGFPVGGYYGTNIPGPFTSTHPSGTLTFVFMSEPQGTIMQGWEAMVSCGACEPVSNIDITVTSITSNTAYVIWPTAGSETEWEVEYGPDGFAMGSGTIVNVTGSPATPLVNLAPDTEYDVYVTAICVQGGKSAPAGPVSFTSENLGVNNQVFKGFSFYPNPTSDRLILQASMEIGQVVVFDLQGQKVLNAQPVSSKFNLDVSCLQTGIYIIKVTIVDITGVYRIIKE